MLKVSEYIIRLKELMKNTSEAHCNIRLYVEVSFRGSLGGRCENFESKNILRAPRSDDIIFVTRIHIDVHLKDSAPEWKTQ